MNVKVALKPLLLIGDMLILGGAFLLAYYIRFSFEIFPERPLPPLGLYSTYSVLLSLMGGALLQTAGMYQFAGMFFNLDRFFIIFKVVTVSLGIVVIASFLQKGIATHIELEHSRIVIFLSWFLMVVMLTLWRLIMGRIVRFMLKSRVGLTRVVIVGGGDNGLGISQALLRGDVPGYEFQGFLNSQRSGVFQNEMVLGDIDRLAEFAASNVFDEVLLADTTLARTKIAELIKICDRADIKFGIIPGIYEILTYRMTAREIAGFPIFELISPLRQQWAQLCKRCLDVALSVVVLIVFLPLLAVVATIIKLESKGQVLYRQIRVGKGEKLFHIYKFRSMYTENGQEDASKLEPLDGRITPFGRFIRRLSIDELLQVFNVLKGDMSWVGPRPHIPEEVALYQADSQSRFDVLPGITGLTQVSGRKDLTLDEMVRLDIYYIENWSLWLDIKILLKTIPAVIGGRGAY